MPGAAEGALMARSRSERLAQQLRANLKRRKAQSRERAERESAPMDDDAARSDVRDELTDNEAETIER